jgi:hypothetical protein
MMTTAADCAAGGVSDACADSDTCTDTCTAGRVIQIVCAPSEGKEWCTDAFAEAWKASGFGDAEDGAREWFPDDPELLGSSLDALLEDGDGEAPEEEDEEVLTVVDGGGIAVSWEGRRCVNGERGGALPAFPSAIGDWVDEDDGEEDGEEGRREK